MRERRLELCSRPFSAWRARFRAEEVLAKNDLLTVWS